MAITWELDSPAVDLLPFATTSTQHCISTTKHIFQFTVYIINNFFYLQPTWTYSFINLFVQYSQSDLPPLRPHYGEAPPGPGLKIMILKTSSSLRTQLLWHLQHIYKTIDTIRYYIILYYKLRLLYWTKKHCASFKDDLLLIFFVLRHYMAYTVYKVHGLSRGQLVTGQLL